MFGTVAWGSATAKGGFQNERDVATKFTNWKYDDDAKQWLTAMGYDWGFIDYVSAQALSVHKGKKIDVSVFITMKDGTKQTENISLKKVKKGVDYNQVDKRWVREYKTMWNLTDSMTKGLKMFTGDDYKRCYLSQLPNNLKSEIVEFFSKNKERVVRDLIKGVQKPQPNWIMATLKNGKTEWILRDIESALKIFASGDVHITKKGNLLIGRIVMQRKGGDSGRPTANMLQFKIHPTDLKM